MEALTGGLETQDAVNGAACVLPCVFRPPCDDRTWNQSLMIVSLISCLGDRMADEAIWWPHVTGEGVTKLEKARVPHQTAWGSPQGHAPDDVVGTRAAPSGNNSDDDELSAS